MEQLMVGKKYPAFRRDDGVLLSYNSSGIRLIYIMGGPSSSEVRDIKSGSNLEIRMGVIGDHIVWVVKPGKQPWSDCTFAPATQPNEPYGLELDEGIGLAMTLELYDGYTGELVALRVIGLPHDFSVSFLENCRQLLQRKPSSADIYRSFMMIMARDTTALVAMCKQNAKIGGGK